MSLIILPVVPYMGALLGLLLVWRHHDRHVEAGNPLMWGLFRRNGTRLYLFVAPDSNEVCQACRDVHGTVFHPRLAEARDFSPRKSLCNSPEVCASVLIGFHGGWREAGDLTRRLAKPASGGRLKLSLEEISRFAKGWSDLCVEADRDRIGVQMVIAQLTERHNPNLSAKAYGVVICKAKEDHHLPFLIPAYLRLTSLLAKRGDARQALQIIEHFERRYYRSEPGPHYPSAKQRRAMAVMKPYLFLMSDPSNREVTKPATTTSWQ